LWSGVLGYDIERGRFGPLRRNDLVFEDLGNSGGEAGKRNRSATPNGTLTAI